ncbi:MAG: hypothetical protein MUF49_06485 [Oculatellaceae cyanobacterium Prado106]|jgi:hypothetical protein|nr:hypothetical protein [Oculatellaceae cyanobacterium Prado106]
MPIAPSPSQSDIPLEGLTLALTKLVDQQEKTWGYFQVVKNSDDEFQLVIPGFPKLSLQRGSDRYSYKATWSDKKEAVVYVRRKTKEITSSKITAVKKTEKLTPKSSAKAVKLSPNKSEVPKQRIYEVFYRLDGRPGFRLIQQQLAIEIRDRLQAQATSDDRDEMPPLVLLSQAD